MNMLKVRRDYKDLWPHLRHIWPWDRQYTTVSPELLQEFSDAVRKIKIVFPDGTEVTFGDLMNLGDFWDCDDFAAGGDFLTKLYYKGRAEKEGLPRLPIPYGQARGSMFRTRPGLHALNSCVTTEGIYFNDHDDRGRIWPAKEDQDSIFYVSV